MGHDLFRAIEGHWLKDYDSSEGLDDAKHDVDVVPGTVLYRLLGRTQACGGGHKLPPLAGRWS